jgi:putative endonuclease
MAQNERTREPSPIRKAAEVRGRRAETWAALLLLCKGYRIIGRRVKTHAGEIDLIARSPTGITCFIEVKARDLHDRAGESILPRQQARIVRAAELYLASRQGLTRKGVRFDAVLVANKKFPRHVKDAWRPG